MKKLIICTLVLLASVFCLCISPAKANPSLVPDEFNDLRSNHWAYKHIMQLKDLGIVVGYPDGSYRPDADVTRAEFATIVIKALNLQDKGNFYPVDYKDLSEQYWGYTNIQIATHYGLVVGTPDGYFLPNDPVKRVEVIMVLMNTLALKELNIETADEYLSVYEDMDDVPGWAKIRTGKAQQLAMIATRPEFEGKLMPMVPATRAEIAVFIVNMLERVKVHPNKRIASELPKMADGYVLDNVYLDGTIAIIPAGTILPLGVMTHTDSSEAQEGDNFTARALKHFVNKDNILLIPVGTRFIGKVDKVQKSVPVVKNANMVLAISDMLDTEGDTASVFPAVADTNPTLWLNHINPGLEKFNFNVWKGRDFILHRSQVKEFILLEPVRIDVMDNWIYQ